MIFALKQIEGRITGGDSLKIRHKIDLLAWPNPPGCLGRNIFGAYKFKGSFALVDVQAR